MRWLINYIRSCFCKHEWELLDRSSVYGFGDTRDSIPMGTQWTYRCEKCGYFQTYKDH